MSRQHFGHVLHAAVKESANLKPVGADKSAFAAFFAGFLFGPIGLGIYLRSGVDFLMSLGLVVVGSIMTVGIGAPFFWALCGFWGAMRVAQSKRNA